MAQPPRNRLNIGILSQEQRCSGMAEVMEPDFRQLVRFPLASRIVEINDLRELVSRR